MTLDFLFFVGRSSHDALKTRSGRCSNRFFHFTHLKGLQSNMQGFFNGPFISGCCIFVWRCCFLLPSQGLNMLHLKVGRHPLKAPILRASLLLNHLWLPRPRCCCSRHRSYGCMEFLWRENLREHTKTPHQPNAAVSKSPYFSGFLRDDAGLPEPAKRPAISLGFFETWEILVVGWAAWIPMEFFTRKSKFGNLKIFGWKKQVSCMVVSRYVLVLCLNLISLIQCIIGVCFALLGLILPWKLKDDELMLTKKMFERRLNHPSKIVVVFFRRRICLPKKVEDIFLEIQVPGG